MLSLHLILSKIILICKETNNLLQVEEYACKASSLYQQHGSPESAASALDKASKVVEQKHPDIALRFYQRALEISMVSKNLFEIVYGIMMV